MFTDLFGDDFVHADTLEGTYAGDVLHVTDNYTAQIVGTVRDTTVVLHDRALLDSAPESHINGPAEYEIGEYLKIHYTENHAPEVFHAAP